MWQSEQIANLWTSDGSVSSTLTLSAKQRNIMKEYFAPDRNINFNLPSIFLAGSIEMGLADDWQSKIVDALKYEDVLIFNPRRIDWDSSWEQSIDNPQFTEQVNWELDMLTVADRIVMYFDPNTKSPISLLELGLFVTKKNMLVCCPPGFWRKGNVDIVCDRFNIPVYEDIESLITALLAQ